MTIKFITVRKISLKACLFFSILGFFLVPFHSFAQSQSVTGTINGSDGSPLSGVTVQEKGAKTGTATDASGNFSLTVSRPGAILVVSSLGYETQNVSLSGRTNVSVSLKGAAAKELEQVVVIGYGTANKRDLTGSIVKISGKEVADKPNTNPVASLQGKVAGLSVVNNGTPGAAPDIRIRGTVSIGQVHPLYVVDGIFNDNIDYINPNDIESIEVLKDPSSLAIFGVKGATGVIAITTKKAKAGQTIINLSTNYGFKNLVDKIKFVNANDFKTLFAEERALAVDSTTAPYDYTGLTANTDWIDAVTRTAHFNNDNLSISSSTDKNRFNFGVGYYYDEGIIKHQQLDKYLLSFNDEATLYKGIKVGVNFNVSRQNNPYDVTSTGTNVLDEARKVVPLVSSGTKNFAVRDPYGIDTINMDLYSGLNPGLQSGGVVNPLVQLENEWNKRKSYELRTLGSVFAEINFLKYFNFRSTLYADISNVNTRRYFPKYYDYNPVTNLPELIGQQTGVQEDDNNYKKYQQDYILNFKKNFGDHNLTLTGGFTTYYFGNFNTTGKTNENPLGQPIPDDPRFWYLTNGFEDPTTKSTSSSQSEYSTVSYLARALYSYKNKYFLNGSFRNDASSRLPTKNQNQQFWAVGAAWDISKENFMASQTIVNFLKLKGSIGRLGNQSASQLDGTPINYPAYPNLSTGTNAVFGTNVFSAAKKAYIENPDLKWETVDAQEIGIELSAFKNRLHFEANYYNKTTNDLLTYVSRATLGLPDELINGGSIRNRGEEFSASWNQDLGKELVLTFSGNITFQKNKVLSLSKDLPLGFLSRAYANNGSAESRTIPGYPIGSFYGYVQEGIYQDSTDIAKSPDASSILNYRPGDLKFKDVNGDGKITADDRTVIGDPSPKGIYGASIGLTYKGISLGVDVNGVWGNKIFRVWGSLESPFQRVNYTADQLNRWHGPGTSNRVPILGQSDRFNYNGSTYNIEDGSYFRIRNIQLGYNFSQNLLSGARIKGLRVYANVQNLKTFKHNLGYTTEYGGDATAFGFDFGGGAIPVITTFGLNVTF